MSAMPMLSVESLCASYGGAQALFGVDLRVAPGEVVSLMGRNGMGKSTVVKAVMGMVPISGGSVSFKGEPLNGLSPIHIARKGIGVAPEGRQIFSTLTVRENLVATARAGGPWALRQIYDLFPRLGEREGHMGNQLSGGEQQMLSIGRALMTNPSLLVLDEATEGLAPLICQEIWNTVGRLRQEGQAILVIDKNLRVLSALCDRHVILEKGRTAWEGSSSDLQSNVASLSRYLSV